MLHAATIVCAILITVFAAHPKRNRIKHGLMLYGKEQDVLNIEMSASLIQLIFTNRQQIAERKITCRIDATTSDDYSDDALHIPPSSPRSLCTPFFLI